MVSIRDNWRIVMLVILLLASAFALFGPGGGAMRTTTNRTSLSAQQSAITVDQGSVILDNTTLQTKNVSDNSTAASTVTISNANVDVQGEVSNVTSSSATVANATITVTGGTVVSPANTTEITATNRSITVGSGTLQLRDSSINVTIEHRTSTGPTNLKYGFDLSGGTRIRATLVGDTVHDVTLSQDQSVTVGNELPQKLGIDPIDVRIRRSTHTIEVFDDSVSESQITNALQSLNIDHGKITDGVTKKTRSEVVSTLQSKIDKTGLSGGTVTTVGDNLIVVEVPNTKPQEVKNIVSDRGVVRVIAEVQNGNTTTNKTVLTASDLTQIGAVGQRDSGGWEVPVTVKQGAANRFQQEMNDLGFTGPGVGRCARTGTGSPGSSWCLLTTLDGKLVRANSMGPGLANDMQDGSWAKTQSFTIGAPTFKSAQELKISLQVGSLPTKLDLSGSKYDLSYLQPSLAQKFKPYSLLTGLVAWLAVSGVIFFRYRKVAVAVPMLLTAAAEVFILLGFAAATGLALNLSHIAGLIAVIGTGVDDLVIIADEVLQQGDVATGRVFQSRFRKAFWVIGGAAATTIIAMSPLTVLSVGDLFGFAIVTIVGVLIGVLVTRPAYGDILRNFVLDES